MRQFVVLLLCLAWQAIVPAWAKGQAVWVALSRAEAPYTDAAQAVRARLPGHEVSVRLWREFLDGREPAPRVVVAVGVEAANGMAEAAADWPRTVVVALLVSRSQLDALAGTRAGRLTGVYFDQPLGRLARFLGLVLPDGARVGVLLGPSSRRQQADVRQALRGAGLVENIRLVGSGDELPDQVRDVLADADALLALPDTTVHNSRSAHYVLLSSYKRGIPVIGYSESFVRAGAAAALVSTPEQLGMQAGDLVDDFLHGGDLPEPQAPASFRVMVNGNVSRSLGLSLDADALERKMGIRERGR